MTHHIFTISVGILTFVFIALSVANASDRAANPPENTPVVEIVSQPESAGVGDVMQNQKEKTCREVQTGKDSVAQSE